MPRCIRFLMCLTLLSLSLVSVTVLATEPATESRAEPTSEQLQQQEWNRRLLVAKAQRADAKAMKAAAKQRYESESKACFREILVSSCQEKAHRRLVDTNMEARRVDARGAALERQIKKEQLASRDARYLEEAPQRAEDLKESEAATTAERERYAHKRQVKLQKIEQKTALGVQRQVQNERRLEKKQAAHEKRVAEKMEKAQRHAAENEAE